MLLHSLLPGGDIMEEIKKLDKTIISNNVKHLIYISNLTNEELADKLNVSSRLVYYWQAGERIPNMDNIYGLSQLFNIPFESILL